MRSERRTRAAGRGGGPPVVFPAAAPPRVRHLYDRGVSAAARPRGRWPHVHQRWMLRRWWDAPGDGGLDGTAEALAGLTAAHPAGGPTAFASLTAARRLDYQV